MKLKIMGEEVWIRFIGEYNASNLLAVTVHQYCWE